MGSYPLDRPKILKILDKAGPALLQKLCIEPVFMAYLIQADILSYDESESIAAKEGQVYQRQALLSHLRQASVDKFITFCLVLVDNDMKPEVVTEDFGLSIEDLRNQKDNKSSKKTELASSKGAELDTKMKIVAHGKEVDLKIYETFMSIILSSLSNPTSVDPKSPDVEDLVISLTANRRLILNIHTASVVFCMNCPNIESLEDLERLCTSGKLAQLAKNIFTNHPALAEFGLGDVEVSVTVDGDDFTRCKQELQEYNESETVILSVVGHYNRDPDGIVLLDNLLTEQIKQLIPDATILHVVLEDQQKIIADGQQKNFVGYNKSCITSSNSTSSSNWLNYNTKDCYSHLSNHRVSHIIAHAPEFIAGAINIKRDLFPEAKMIMMINEQIDMHWDVDPNMQPGKELVEWTPYAEGLVTLGRQTYDDVQSMLNLIGDPFDHDRFMYFLPSLSLQINQQEAWTKPPDTLEPVILILAGGVETQERQKMILPVVVNAITSVAEDLFKSGIIRKVAVRITGIPEYEQAQLKDDLGPRQNLYTSLDCVKGSSFAEEMKNCHMCILPLGCATHSYGLEFMTSAGFGVPTLFPDSAGFNFDVQEIAPAADHSYLNEMVVQVMAAKAQQEEEQAWMDKIKNTLLNIQQLATNSNTFRQVIQKSHVVQKSQQDLINLLQAHPRKRLPWELSSADGWCPYVELDFERLKYREHQQPQHGPEPICQQYGQYHSQTPDLHLEVITPNNKKTRFLKNWVEMVGGIQPFPLVDVMLAQGSINYVIHKEVHDRVKTHDRYAAMRGLLNVVRRRGEVGINQLERALRDPSVDGGFLADRLAGVS